MSITTGKFRWLSIGSKTIRMISKAPNDPCAGSWSVGRLSVSRPEHVPFVGPTFDGLPFTSGFKRSRDSKNFSEHGQRGDGENWKIFWRPLHFSPSRSPQAGN